jgi:hypothetical protein
MRICDEERIMVYQYHKGSFCVYKPIICQEIYCSECGIHTEKDSNDDKKLENIEKVTANVPGGKYLFNQIHSLTFSKN